jgi:hypothetical protein
VADELSTIAGVLQVIVGGKYEGTLSDCSFTRPRAISQQGMANGKNARGIGIEKPQFNFSRPMLKTATGQQIPIELLDGPIDIDFIWPGTDQQWRAPNFQRANADWRHNPDAGNTSETFSGPTDKPIRIR